MSEKNTMLLVDGSSYLYRAYHAMPDLRSAGFPTGAIHGIVAMMKKLREQIPSDHAVCVFDAPGRTFRDDWYDQYKAHRAPMPEPLAQQLEPICEVVRLLGWPVLTVPGVEADDAIGTLACVAARAGHRVVVSTGDKDLAQLVSPQVTLINTMTNETLDVAAVEAKFGVPPGRIVDYLTLLGDSVDNIPGVDKVGPKTAARWIAEYGSLDGVIAAAPTIKGAAGDNLRRALDWLPQGRRLVTVRCDCELADHVAGWPALDALKLRDVDRDALLAFYERYGFRAWKRELEQSLGRAPSGGAEPAPSFEAVGDEPQPAPIDLARDYEVVTTWERLDHWLDAIARADSVAIDTESDDDDAVRARLVGIGVAVEPGRAAYVPLAHAYADAPDQLPAADVLQRLKPWLEDAARAKVGHNVKHDSQVFANAGVDVRGWVDDTMLLSYVLEAHRPHVLASLAERHVGRRGLQLEDVCGKGVGRIPFAQVDVARAAEYCGANAETALHVQRVLGPRVAAQPGLAHVYRTIELPLSAVLARVERHGVLVDAAFLAQQSRDLAERLVALEQQAHAAAGKPFNLGSPKQICEILFTKLGLPVKKRTASGTPSTDEDVLAELAADYPLPAAILEHRGLAKLKGTYTDKLPAMVNPATGRVHTCYGQAVAVTGRLASNDPNLQNIPIRTAEGRRIREAFVAPAGHSILSADYSQVELRIMAHISEDPALLRAFSEGIDVHRATAAEVFNVALDDVSSEQRRYAKVINFGLIYGMGAFGLATNLGIETKAARDYIERYFARFAGVRRYMDGTRSSARERGYVETVFGRRLWLPEINSGNGPRRAGSERQAINAPMQGTAADLIKMAMIAVQRALDAEQRATKMVLQVHDELVFEVPDAELDWARTAIPRLMANVAPLRVPLLADVGVGRNWDEAH